MENFLNPLFSEPFSISNDSSKLFENSSSFMDNLNFHYTPSIDEYDLPLSEETNNLCKLKSEKSCNENSLTNNSIYYSPRKDFFLENNEESLINKKQIFSICKIPRKKAKLSSSLNEKKMLFKVIKLLKKEEKNKLFNDLIKKIYINKIRISSEIEDYPQLPKYILQEIVEKYYKNIKSKKIEINDKGKIRPDKNYKKINVWIKEFLSYLIYYLIDSSNLTEDEKSDYKKTLVLNDLSGDVSIEGLKILHQKTLNEFFIKENFIDNELKKINSFHEEENIKKINEKAQFLANIRDFRSFSEISKVRINEIYLDIIQPEILNSGWKYQSSRFPYQDYLESLNINIIERMETCRLIGNKRKNIDLSKIQV